MTLPHALTAAEGRYLLIGFTDGRAAVFGVSDIETVEVLEQTGTAPADFDTEGFILREVYGFEDGLKPVIIRCEGIGESELAETFGKRVHILINGRNDISAAVEIPPKRILPWAMQNIDRCEIISPPELRETVIERVKRSMYRGSE